MYSRKKKRKKVLPTLISEDQTGVMANRYIGNNARLIYDSINYWLDCYYV